MKLVNKKAKFFIKIKIIKILYKISNNYVKTFFLNFFEKKFEKNITKSKWLIYFVNLIIEENDNYFKDRIKKLLTQYHNQTKRNHLATNVSLKDKYYQILKKILIFYNKKIIIHFGGSTGLFFQSVNCNNQIKYDTNYINIDINQKSLNISKNINFKTKNYFTINSKKKLLYLNEKLFCNSIFFSRSSLCFLKKIELIIFLKKIKNLQNTILIIIEPKYNPDAYSDNILSPFKYYHNYYEILKKLGIKISRTNWHKKDIIVCGNGC